jgi:hypothetical protein
MYSRTFARHDRTRWLLSCVLTLLCVPVGVALSNMSALNNVSAGSKFAIYLYLNAIYVKTDCTTSLGGLEHNTRFTHGKECLHIL